MTLSIKLLTVSVLYVHMFGIKKLLIFHFSQFIWGNICVCSCVKSMHWLFIHLPLHIAKEREYVKNGTKQWSEVECYSILVVHENIGSRFILKLFFSDVYVPLARFYICIYLNILQLVRCARVCRQVWDFKWMSFFSLLKKTF